MNSKVCNLGRSVLKKSNLEFGDEIKKARLKLSIEHYIKYFIGKRACELTKEEALYAISLAVREFAMDNPIGTYVVGTGSHVVCIINGNFFDSWNSSDESILYFWTK